MLGWLDRLAAKLNRNVTPTAAAMGAENAPTLGQGTGAAVVEIKKEQEEQQT